MLILIADQDPNIRYGLAAIAEQVQGGAILEEATNRQELLQQVTRCCPDVLLISQEFPGLSAGGLVDDLNRVCPALLTIILKVNPARDLVRLPEENRQQIAVIEKPEQLHSLLRRIGRQPAPGTKNKQRRQP